MSENYGERDKSYITRPLTAADLPDETLQNMSKAELIGAIKEEGEKMDVKHAKHIEAEEKAIKDPLTQLLNKNGFNERLKGEIDRFSRYHDRLGLLMIDLDNFKPVNDMHGHIAGDEVLIRVADMIREAVRESDVAARLGGDEFAILLPHQSENHAAATAERLLNRILGTALQLSSGQAVRIGATIGVASLQKGDTKETLLSHADDALYYGKFIRNKNVLVRYGKMHEAEKEALRAARQAAENPRNAPNA